MLTQRLLAQSLPWLTRFLTRSVVAVRLTGESVTDLVQDVCLEALDSRELREAVCEAQIRSALRSIASRLIDERRRLALERRRGARRRRPLDDLADVLPARDESLAAVVNENDVRDRITGAIRNLPRGQRDVLTEQWLRGRTTAEISRALGRTPNAVRLLRSRGIAALREILGVQRAGTTTRDVPAVTSNVAPFHGSSGDSPREPPNDESRRT